MEGWERTLDLARPIQETLAGHDDFYVRVMGARYGSILRGIATLGEGRDAAGVKKAEWEKANLALVMYGTHTHDFGMVHDAFQLLQTPTGKWQAAVWANRHDVDIVYPWTSELADAEQQASQDSQEAYGVAVAKLEGARREKRESAYHGDHKGQSFCYHKRT